MKLFTQFFIALTPLVFSFSTSDPTLSIRFLFFSIFISIIVAFDFYRKESFSVNVIKHPFSISLVILFITYLMSTLINGISAESIYFLSKLFLIVIFVFVVSSFLLKYSFKEFLLPLLLFSFFSSIIYFYQFLDQYNNIILIEDVWHRNRAFDSICGSMGHKNLLASIHLLLLPALVYSLNNKNKWIKVLSSISLFFTVIIFFQTQSRAVIGAILITVSSFVFLSKISRKGINNLFKYLFFLLIFGLIFLFSLGRLDSFKKEITKTINFSSSQRFALYNCTSDLILDNLFFGVGPGNWRIKIWEYGLYNNTFGDSFAQRPHNDFLWFFAEGGFFAGICYILIFLILLKDSYWLIKNHEDSYFFKLIFSVLLAYGFVSFLDFPFERISHIIVFLLLASIIISSKLRSQENKRITFSFLSNAIILIISLFVIHVGYTRYNSEVHTNNAIKLKQEGNWNYVVRAIDKAYSQMFYDIDNTSTPLLWYRGVAYFSMKNYKLALKDFKKAYDVNPNHIHVLNNLGTSYQLVGNSELAKSYYNKAINITPSFKEARVNLSAILFNEQKYLDALNTILRSKVELYWKRKRNKDNYDFYLETIFKAYVNDVKDQVSKEELNSLERMINYFNEQPAATARKLRLIHQKAIDLDIDFASAFLIVQ